MLKKLISKAKFLTILTLSLVLTSCNKVQLPTGDKSADQWTTGISVWVAYWDLDDAKSKIQEIKDDIAGISYFAAYFDKNNDLFIPKALTEFKDNLLIDSTDGSTEYYLTIVNDKALGDSSLLKDTDLLRSIFSDEEAMRSHINQIITLAVDGEYDGIDIDYEAIRTDIDLWERFIIFCELLIKETEASGLKLRVILEPNAPLDKLTFPEGPEYVMMCYNLYGTDTSRGPKANDKFLQEMLKKMDYLPGTKGFALATGGFRWTGSGKGISITESEASELSKGSNVYRSNDSGALTFQYYDEDGLENTVWYADEETLQHWGDIILSAGAHNIMIWRIE